MNFDQQIRDKAKELLEGKAVECVIGYERATDGLTARPLFLYDSKQTDRLICDNTCVHNLAKYLLNKKGKKTAIVAKACDARSINLLINEKQVKREEVFIIGMVCEGVVETKWGQKSENLVSLCRTCLQHTPPVYDFLVGDKKTEETVTLSFSDVDEMGNKPLEERREFWNEQFSRCIRCYACRQVCPGCYCTECFVERLDPLWVGIRITPSENELWNTIRAFHLAGRCIGCRECQRVCPMNIPLMLVNRRLEKEVWELFNFQAGMSPDTPAPFAIFKKDEHLEVG